MNKTERIKTAKKIALALAHNNVPNAQDMSVLEAEGCTMSNEGRYLKYHDKTGQDLALKYPKLNKNTVYAYDMQEYARFLNIEAAIGRAQDLKTYKKVVKDFDAMTWEHEGLKNELTELINYVYRNMKEEVKIEEPEELKVWEDELSRNQDLKEITKDDIRNLQEAVKEGFVAPLELATYVSKCGIDGVRFETTSCCIWAFTDARKEELKLAGFKYCAKRKHNKPAGWYFSIPKVA